MEELAFWRNVALVVLAIQGFVILVLAVAPNYGIVRLMNYLHTKSTDLTRAAQRISRVVSVQTDVYTDRVTRPVVQARSRATRIRVTLRSLLSGKGAPGAGQ